MTLYERIRETGSDVGAEAKRILESVDARDDATTERVEWLKTELQRVLDILLEHRARDAALRALVEQLNKVNSPEPREISAYAFGQPLRTIWRDQYRAGFAEGARAVLARLSVLLDGAREGAKEQEHD